jgi:hypothetical protein
VGNIIDRQGHEQKQRIRSARGKIDLDF